ncbi:MAG: PQQ-binding-like beta-propeller repeat protein [Bacteroidota bacterium]
MRSRLLSLALGAVLLMAGCSPSNLAGVTPTPAERTPTPNSAEADVPKASASMTAAPPGTAAAGGLDIPPEVAGHEKEWPLANHDYSNTRVATGSTINAGNVANLQVAWTSSLKGTAEWGAGTGNPIISDGVVYFQDLAANIYAVKFDTGDLIWETQYNNMIFGPSGPGIGYGKVFALSRIDRYSALDLKTGKELWLYDSGTKQPAGAFQPYVFGHQVYVANEAAPSGKGQIIFHSYQGGSSGVATLLNPENGQPAWHFQVVEEGFWGHPEVNSGGGLWFPPAIDTQSGLSYWASGNPSPVPGLKGWPNGSSRPGPNLYTNSLLALDHHTGKLVCYNQVKPHDLFNLDFQVSPMLATASINGSERKIVIGSGKLGVVYAFDAQTCETLWKTPVGLHQNDSLQELPLDQSTTWVAPGAWGGVETPMAYADGAVYALTDNLPSPYNATAFDASTPEQALNRSEGGTIMKNGTAQLYALDAVTGQVLWTHDFDRVAFGGVTVVNDLLFTATLDGNIYALSRQDGSVVWQWQAPGGTNSWPAVVGDTIIWAFGLGDSPSIIALRLNAGGSPPTPEQQRTPVLTPEGG